ncbi:zinc-dependent alcohol dehydrogenase [Paenibacillus eucommiae]|uniref:2-desacetyl-2-hydroxyethyl bacteriochlorophyllide A dehydrogenase n=1 Tax=Paenibacillus eucommiae TaxID=1355755 RepID=A0ABS4IZ85_9BACL|nr:zinc-binding alcohol dehydrogenase [Paenibacillus eucommiae]MBP1992281.1 2-desacetyl-2-hydroxyethyl bacteriochlorophyllide A dehydrogenase [Paenibacillus eucommiae]
MNYAITFTDYAQAELLEVDPVGQPGPDEIVAETIYSLISPGTELSAGYLGEPPFPKGTGYATVSKVLQAGEQVTHVKPGDQIFAMGNHRSRQILKGAASFPLPAGLEPWKGTISRLMGVSMTTLITTYARPGDRVLVMGAGPVGYLAAHIFRNAGYEVTVCDPDVERLKVVKASGNIEVYESVSNFDEKHRLEPFALVLECSGHEAALLDGLRAVRRRGEVVMVGVPWKRRTDHTAHEITWEVFHKYAVLRSGWEWEMPFFTDEHQHHSIFTNLQTAAKWLQQGKIPLEGLIRQVSPRDAQDTYQALVNRSWQELFIVFDWTRIK